MAAGGAVGFSIMVKGGKAELEREQGGEEEEEEHFTVFLV
jgi:hypothetical protein